MDYPSKIIKKGITDLAKKSDLLAALLLPLKIIQDYNESTFSININRELKYNPTLIHSLQKRNEIPYILCHEGLHDLLLHPLRSIGKDPETYAIAADIVVATYASEMGFTIEKEWVEPVPEWSHKSVEWIYNELLKQKKEEGSDYTNSNNISKESKGSSDIGRDKNEREEYRTLRNSNDSNGGKRDEAPKTGKEIQEPRGSSNSPKGNDPKDSKAKGNQDPTSGPTVRNITDLGDSVSYQLNGKTYKAKKIVPQEQNQKHIEQAEFIMEMMQGSIPAGILRDLKGFLKPNRWWITLENHMNDIYFSHGDIMSWPPNSRYNHLGLTIPRMYSESLDLVVCVDTSGSIRGDALKLFKGALIDVISHGQFKLKGVVIGDAKVERVYQDLEEIESVEFKGGGGTDFRPLYSKASEMLFENGGMIVFLTDGDGKFPTLETYDTLWVLNLGDRKVPFGEKVLIEREN